MNEAKKMKKSITLPFDDNSKRLIIILVVLLFVTGITKSSQFLNIGRRLQNATDRINTAFFVTKLK